MALPPPTCLEMGAFYPVLGARKLTAELRYATLQRREAFRARRTHLHFDVPAGPMLGHPGGKSVMVRLLIRKDRAEPRHVVRRDTAEQERGRHPLIETSTGHQDGQQQAQ